MITLPLPWFVCLYLAFFLTGVLILWIGYEILRKRRDSEIARQRFFCRTCASRYIDLSGSEVTACPACGALNERSAGGSL